MCLYPKSPHVLIAPYDFHVYKNFFSGKEKGTLSSAYMETTWCVGETKRTTYFADDVQPTIKFKTRFPKWNYTVEVGQGLHAWQTKKQAVSQFGHITARCTIPKGTPYIIGNKGDIVSLVLRVDAIVRGKKHLR